MCMTLHTGSLFSPCLRPEKKSWKIYVMSVQWPKPAQQENLSILVLKYDLSSKFKSLKGWVFLYSRFKAEKTASWVLSKPSAGLAFFFFGGNTSSVQSWGPRARGPSSVLPLYEGPSGCSAGVQVPTGALCTKTRAWGPERKSQD